jgi:NADH-quinone oxidoreductase subunit C
MTRHIKKLVPSATVMDARGGGIEVQPNDLLPVCQALKSSPDLEFNYLAAITAVDYIECFELVYHLVSLAQNHWTVIKARLCDRENPTAPSVTSLWQGADLQEREVWDLMGVSFEGHPNLSRVLTWEGFPGHPLRKDHLGG